MAEKRCYTVKDLQEMLDVSRSTVYKLLRQNEFRWIQLEGGGWCLTHEINLLQRFSYALESSQQDNL